MKYVYSYGEVPKVAAQVRQLLVPGTICTLTGLLGAGKTTLVRELLVQCGVTGPITSPTFGYVNTYQTTQAVVHHFDLYRIDTADTFCSLGFEEYLNDKNALVLIEWPAVIASVLERQGNVIAGQISYLADDFDHRVLHIARQEKKDTRKK